MKLGYKQYPHKYNNTHKVRKAKTQAKQNKNKQNDDIRNEY